MTYSFNEIWGADNLSNKAICKAQNSLVTTRERLLQLREENDEVAFSMAQSVADGQLRCVLGKLSQGVATGDGRADQIYRSIVEQGALKGYPLERLDERIAHVNRARAARSVLAAHMEINLGYYLTRHNSFTKVTNAWYVPLGGGAAQPAGNPNRVLADWLLHDGALRLAAAI